MIKVIDIILAAIMLCGIYYIPKNSKYWLLYSFGCFCYIFVHIFYTKLYGYLALEIVAMLIGINNYLKGRK